jgi:4-hydroxy-tetrahydrodipicolinate synthase
MKHKYQGVIVPLLTPFQKDKSIDFKMLTQHVDWLCQRETDIIFAMGGSGEYQTLTLKEKKAIVDCVLDAAARRRIVFIGSGCDTLVRTLELSEHAAKRGAEGIGVIIPTSIQGSQQAIYDYYKEIDETIDLPLMIYDPRGEGVHSIEPETCTRLLDDCQNIVAIKYRTTDGERMGAMARAISHRMSLFSGAETVFLQDLCVGAVGCVGGGGNFYPGLMRSLQNAFENKDLARAKEIQFEILKAIDVLSSVYWPLGGKIVMKALGFDYSLVTRVEGNLASENDIDLIINFYQRYRLS